VKRLPTASLLAYSQHVNRAHSSLRGRSSPFLRRRLSSERCPSCCCCRRSALRAVCAPPHYSRATKSATTATRALLQILFAEADSAPRLAADVRLRRLLYLASRMEHKRKERDGERENDEAVKAGRAQRGLLRCVRGKKERRGGGKREKSFAPRGKHRSRRGASEASSLT